MEWFETVKGTVKKTAEAVGDKSSHVIKIAKLNINITEHETQIEKYFKMLGEKVYNDFKNGTELTEENTILCQDITKCYEKIEELKEEIATEKNSKKCERCGKINDLDSNYCMCCGQKFDVEEL